MAASTNAVAPAIASVNESTNSKAGRLKTVTVTGKRQYTPSLVEASVSGSRLDLTPQEIPASIEILSGDTIRALADASVSLAASRAAGITAIGTPGDGGTALSARGFTGHGSVMQLFDGSQLSVGAGTVTFPFDTWAIDRVEVLRGPSSVLYGQGAIGGAINVVPKKPSRIKSSEVEAAYGSHDAARLGFGSGGPLGEAVSYRLDANQKKSNGWTDRGESESLAIAAALRWDITADLSVTLSHDSGHQEPENYFGTPLIDGKLDESLRDNNYNVRDSILDYDDRWTRLKLEWAASDGIKVSSEVYRLVTERHWRNAETYSWNADSGLIDRVDYLEILHDETQIGNRSVAVFNHEVGGLENSVAIGFDVNTVDFRHTNNFLSDESSSVDVENPDPGYFLNSEGTQLAFKTDTDQQALFAEDRLQLTKQLTVAAGYRHDGADLDREDLRNASNSFDKHFSSSSWRLGSVFNLTENLALYGQYSTGADPVTSLITTAASRKQFEVAKATQIEVGLKQLFMDNRGEWTLAFYDLKKKDLLTRDPANLSRYVQVGEQSSQGVELATTIHIADALTLNANATVLNAEYDEFAEAGDDDELISYKGNVPTDVPEKTANLWLMWDVDSTWQVSAGARYVGKRYSDSANDNELPDFTVVDAGVKWMPLRKTTLALNLLNAFDKDYAVASYGSGQWILGAPRTVEASVNVKF